jgi:hypothetical protein
MALFRCFLLHPLSHWYRKISGEMEETMGLIQETCVRVHKLFTPLSRLHMMRELAAINRQDHLLELMGNSPIMV